MTYVFGPVPSRRLGRSLGVDLIPAKTCTFNCVYCQVGRTTKQTLRTARYAPVRKVLQEIRQKLQQDKPDAITLAGSGEPTLHSGIDKIIASAKELTDTKVAVLTNGSLFWMKTIRQRVAAADVIMPTLCSASENTFQRIHRPHPKLTLKQIFAGLRQLRTEYKGQLWLEVLLLAGINDTPEELAELKTWIQALAPEKIQLNTVVRPPAEAQARALDSQGLEKIKVFLGPRAEIVAEHPAAASRCKENDRQGGLLEMIHRRPLRQKDIVTVLGVPPEEVQQLIKGLLIKGLVEKKKQGGEIYYISRRSRQNQ